MSPRPILLALALLACSGAAFLFGRTTGEHDAARAIARHAATPAIAKSTTPPKATPAKNASGHGLMGLFGFGPLAPAQPESGDDTLPDIAAIPSYEDLLYDQPALVNEQVQRLRPTSPGKVGLYALGFAGDAEENVFRNEVSFLPKLLTRRFDADGRTLQLVNSPYTFRTTPLATRTNLDKALAGIAGRMDKANDILLLFLTSHGSHDHRVFVEMGSMPLDQLSPEDIRDALDHAHITWRVVVISACYSGGFIPALREPHTMIITAARADRPSFGCGSDSQLTWFGKAFLTQALNHTTDFHAAFVEAQRSIAQWEQRDHQKPSEPQFWEGPLIEGKLAAWRASLPMTTAQVPFAPTPRHSLQ
ncbi:MAG TPA: C13 family peptidase [Xanthomonadaceae bacterium]|jgi:hypothetical protein